jgi:hypothetical protein
MTDAYKRVLQPVDEKLCDTRWNTLKELIELTCKKLNEKIDAERDKVDIRFGAEEVARDKALLALEKDLVHLNNLRTEVMTDRAVLVRIEAYNEFLLRYREWQKTVNEKIISMEIHYNERMSVAKWISIGSMVIAALAVLVPWFVHK